MDLKKLSISDQFSYLGSSPRRSIVVSGFGLFLASSFIFLCILLLNYSFKSPFLSPVLSGFSYSDKSTLISWPFSSSSNVSTTSVSFSSKGSHSLVINGTIEGSIHEGNLSQIVKNGNLNVEESGITKNIHELNGSQVDGSRNFSNFSRKGTVLGEKGEVWGNTHVGNFFENVKNGSFVVQESGITKNTPQLNGSCIDGNITFSNFSGASDIGSVNSNVGGPTYVEDVVGSNGERKKVAVIEGKGGVSVERNGGIGSNDGKSLIGRGKDFYGDCDIFDGEWVRDDTKPHYPPGSCPIIDRDFDCHLNKRPDDGYIKWRWQPYACDIPSLNATDFLERLRGQKLVFVGDSLNRNMWESLVCILRHSIRDKKRVYEISGRHEFKKKGFYAFRFEDYNCSVDFVSSPFLVRQSAFKGKNGSFETLRLDLMEKTTSMYSDADIVIFNTGHWWTHEKTSRGEDYYQEGNHVHARLKVLEAYKRALSTWARWVDKNLDGSRTQIFFRGYSATHFRGGPWNLGGQCHKETEPIFKKAYLKKYPSKMKVLHHVLHNMTTPVIYMNISRLTDYRKDGHPSIYRKEYKTVEEQMAGVHAQDCSHWCLPGVPDTWNELLYASLLKSRKGLWKN
ncbi:protein trichome birefringence-like 2 [Nicotiana sylvestris]|uniref:Protein trichome birefringence-like 2 n=1 Tax=Nicotiana sylvestris TaxID=4096 RepID=A0A1U7Y9N3_NICSY|nr:PREDICTED: protein trichome birefringence-like 2 [Nicotiana sylvestris]